MNLRLMMDENFEVKIPKKYASRLIEQGYGFEEGEYLRLESFEALYLMFKNQASLEFIELR